MDVRISLLTLRLFLASFKRKISIRWDRFMDVYEWLAQLFTYPKAEKRLVNVGYEVSALV